ncbi:preprotein translocase subunit SecA [Anaeromyxobacter diazotrophicus]|uniref:Protein translocase subunit SecA n=1 Tax=Anaeromyxobacter diazotrophicus TaxID=2590199 RepID=A0A7I9VGV5_9BACT|nr:preprotein translocase subunit SecA [Anaeromyxobacter diazotrophicus]GEJ55370.1 protein translocase subunit SecA [Anaeromyxobacter diazotrophicus]
MLNYVLKKIVGTKNERELRRITPLVAQVAALEPKMKALADDDFPRLTARWKEEVQQKGRPLEELMPEVFAAVREAGVRALGMRHFDVQLIGGAVLHHGKIAEMKTGEGKTLVATLPCALNALAGRGVHVVTVNDYLARRDAEWMGRLYRFLGLSTGVIVHGLTDQERQREYGCDITYGQNNEFGFDYLRDNMKFRLQDYVQRELHYAIVDEVDSILIDEARTPLIISGPSDEATDKYYVVNQVIPSMIKDQDFTVDEKTRTVVMTDSGIGKMEKKLGVGNLYDPDQIELLHHVEQALRAHHLYRNEVDYVVKEGEVVIVDEFTGRIMPGRRWSDGLHQAIEAKEGVKIENENQTLATISFQNYFRMYSKLAGMTGTADTEAAEFADIYKLDVVVIPTNRKNVRKDSEDVVYKTEREKFGALCTEIEERSKKGQPILVGTVSVAKSEVVSSLLKKRGVPHNVLNAKHHQREAEIVAQAGRKGAVTISTNMAGRGTDILLGGNPEMMAKHELGPAPDAPMEGEEEAAFQERRADWEKRLAELTARLKEQTAKEHEEVTAAGGLHIVGTERHESRRIDNQLRGRGGRQGDPGSSIFYLSLEDDLMRIFGSDRISRMMETLGMKEGEQIEHRWLTKAIENAQKKVEAHNFDIRKNLLEYDDVMNQQRKSVYRLRRMVLGFGAGVPVVEFDEDPKTRKKTRREQVWSWDDEREHVLDLIEDLVVDMVANTCPEGTSPAKWDLDALSALVKDQFGLEVKFTGPASGRGGEARAAIEEQVYNVVEKAYRAKEEQLGKDQDGVPVLRRWEQYIYLQSIDQLWKDHLLAMDHLRQGIGLRGYGQKDPKQEYKKEGYEMFVQMTWRVKSAVIGNILRLQLVRQETAEEIEAKRLALARRQRVTESHGAEADGEARKPVKQETVVRTQPKVGRNDPCPCGSGKKYKKCHGATEATA